MATLMLLSKSTIVSSGQSLCLMSLRVTSFPARSINIRKTWNGCSRNKTGGSPFAGERSSPVVRSRSNAPKRAWLVEVSMAHSEEQQFYSLEQPRRYARLCEFIAPVAQRRDLPFCAHRLAVSHA